MTAEADLTELLCSLTVSRRPGVYTVVTLEGEPSPSIRAEAAAVIDEDEGTTLVVPTEVARANGWAVDFEAAWLTLDVHSALDAVGLTAAVSTALTDAGIACNVLAGYHHDHLLVPVHRVDTALNALATLRHR